MLGRIPGGKLAGALIVGEGKAQRQSKGVDSLEGSGFVRFVGILVLLALAGLIGLFVYGQMMEPETHEIQTEVTYEAQ